MIIVLEAGLCVPGDDSEHCVFVSVLDVFKHACSPRNGGMFAIFAVVLKAQNGKK